MSFVKIDVENKIAHVTLDRAPANALTDEMYWDIAHAMQELGERKDVAVIVLRATGKIFCGGNDISAFSTVSTIRTACRYVQFPAKADMTISALSGTDINFCTICKHNIPP